MQDDSLHQQMNALARNLQGQAGAEATLQHVVDAARALVDPCATAGITLATRRGEVRTSAATDWIPKRGDELQIEHGEGPCRDAVWEHHTVLVRNLPYERRWPTWAPRATEELGMRSMLCLRLFTHHDRIGALNLYAEQPDAFDDQAIEVGHAVAAHAAVALAAAEKIEQLETGLFNRTTIGQATGIVMNGYGMTSTAAFAFLARVSSQTNRKLSTIAQEIVADHDRAQAPKPAPARRMPPAPPGTG